MLRRQYFMPTNGRYFILSPFRRKVLVVLEKNTGDFSMVIGMIGLIIGILVLCFGIYYLVKEKHDAESKKIYSIISVIGAVIAIAAALILFL